MPRGRLRPFDLDKVCSQIAKSKSVRITWCGQDLLAAVAEKSSLRGARGGPTITQHELHVVIGRPTAGVHA